MVISKKQLLLTNNGEIVLSKNLKDKNIFWWNGTTYKPIRVIDVKDSKVNLHKFITSQGRIINCPFNTNFLGNPNSSWINYSKFKDLSIQSVPGASKKTTVSVLGYLKIFGDSWKNKLDIDCLKSSFYLFQNKRPNPYTKLNITLALSKLAESDLKYVLKPFLSEKIIKHLTSFSKDFLIMLLSRLGVAANGHSDHCPLTEPGTIRFKGSLTEPLKYENLRYAGKINEPAIKIRTEFPTDNLLIGSFICQTPS